MRLAVFAVAAVCLVGCGGGDAGPAPSQVAATYVGNYIGWWDSPGGSNESAAVTVSKQGVISGSLVDSTAADNGTLNVTMNFDGQLSGTIVYPGGTATVQGTYQQTTGGFAGTVTETLGKTSSAEQFSLTQQ